MRNVAVAITAIAAVIALNLAVQHYADADSASWFAYGGLAGTLVLGAALSAIRR